MKTLCLFFLAPLCLIHTPGPLSAADHASPISSSGFEVDTSNRNEVAAFYQRYYRASEGFSDRVNWSGDPAAGTPGVTSEEFRADVLRRINWFRAMAGVSATVSLDPAKNAKAQSACLAMVMNRDASGIPGIAWANPSDDVREALQRGIRSLYLYGPPAIDLYMMNPGARNVLARRLLLDRNLDDVGLGDIPFSGGVAANCLYLRDASLSAPRVAPEEGFASWPNSGYVPYQVTPRFWSLHRAGADFSHAVIRIDDDREDVPVSIVYRNLTDEEGTLVWEMSAFPVRHGLSGQAPDEVIGVPSFGEQSFNVTVDGIRGEGISPSLSYRVTVFDPFTVYPEATITGNYQPGPEGDDYTFTQVDQSEGYELSIAQLPLATTPWTHGAEDSDEDAYLDQTSYGSVRLATAAAKTGEKVFHLCFPSERENEQILEIDRDNFWFFNTPLAFSYRQRYASPSSRLSLEITTDDSTSWKEIWGVNGAMVADGSTLDDFAWTEVAVPVSSNDITRIRFRYHVAGLGDVHLGAGGDFGFFLDDLSLPPTYRLEEDIRSTLAPEATSFRFDSSTAGGRLIDGPENQVYYALRIRPQLGGRYLDFGLAFFTYVIYPEEGFYDWVKKSQPDLAGGPEADDDGDGLSNGYEFAFGLDPLDSADATAAPMAKMSEGELVIEFAPPEEITGVTYIGEMSRDLQTWIQIEDTGSDGMRRFAAPAGSGESKMFIRVRVEWTQSQN